MDIERTAEDEHLLDRDRKDQEKRLRRLDTENPALARLSRRIQVTDSLWSKSLAGSKLKAVRMLLDFILTDFQSASAQQVADWVAWVEVIADRKPGPVRRRERLSADVMARLAKELKRGVDRLLEGKAWAPKTNPKRFIVPAPAARLVNRYLGDLRSRFLNAAIDDIILSEFRRIHRCERLGCCRLFVKRKRARYCSKYCQQKVISGRFFKSMSEDERSKYAHGWYRKRVEKRKGKSFVKNHVRPRSKPDKGA